MGRPALGTAPRLELLHPTRGRGTRLVSHASLDPLAALGSDFLLFLGATVLVVPVFKVGRAVCMVPDPLSCPHAEMRP